MNIVTDFEDWSEQIDLEDYEDVYALYLAISSLIDCGGFSITEEDDDSFTLSAIETDDDLVIPTEGDRQELLRYLNKRYGGDLEDIESTYQFRRSMNKND
jgi:hypothetical protein